MSAHAHAIELPDGHMFKLAAVATIAMAAVYLVYTIGGTVKKATTAIATGAADLWVSLTASGPVNVLGNVTLPGGSVVPISTLTWKHDNQGNSYTMVNGSLYELSARDASGNFTLTLHATP